MYSSFGGGANMCGKFSRNYSCKMGRNEPGHEVVCVRCLEIVPSCENFFSAEVGKEIRVDRGRLIVSVKELIQATIMWKIRI
jgi:hypothetical protein